VKETVMLVRKSDFHFFLPCNSYFYILSFYATLQKGDTHMKIRCSSLLFLLATILITCGCAHNKTIEGHSAIKWFQIGNQAFIDNRLNEALDAYNKAIELKPKDVVAYYIRGIIYGKLGNYKLSVADFDRAIELNPKYAKAYNHRGSAYEKLGNYEQAIADIKIAAGLGDSAAQKFLTKKGIEW